MTKNNTITVALLAFIAGCMGGPAVESLVVRPLSAQQAAAGVQRWEYQCGAFGGAGPSAGARNATELAQGMGAEGWELASATGQILCFKRPL